VFGRESALATDNPLAVAKLLGRDPFIADNPKALCKRSIWSRNPRKIGIPAGPLSLNSQAFSERVDGLYYRVRVCHVDIAASPHRYTKRMYNRFIA